MFKSVVFYNHFGNGDIFESREFVKEYMEKIPADNYYYAHGKPPKILADIKGLQFTEVTEAMQPMSATSMVDGTLYLNTWIGRNGRYVLPGIGCVVEKLHEMHNDILRSLDLGTLKNSAFYYLPSIDYSYYNTEAVDYFVNKYPQRKVLISNGNVQSSQAVNFDFTPVITMLAEALPETIFILTERKEISMDNVIFTDEITKVEDGFDLNEISYLSLFCNTHVGRNSGPHVFAQVKENWLDPNKVSLSFTKVRIASHFIYSLPTEMKRIWSPSNNNNIIYQAMYNAIERIG